jgi:hypothetical protein
MIRQPIIAEDIIKVNWRRKTLFPRDSSRKCPSLYRKEERRLIINKIV